ncbi:MATE family efflux transporter [Tessaracoccus lapidicaptus]|uniref:Probable multidrug resistance protein NorM n=1 Tax=Tessaracoccus lapidicaptus TaxID=1427523 RepID=A0A1C0ALY1_9ACTN|nr:MULTISPECIES: MATE family efflux transporter [Tessaracoccus]AQX15517.1 MATE family efflux transporter [Tessaracoccus sp. T2.5-30]OCL33885.1 MATE family efflux transporter [Tessaracoccus lapidicaptus]VEP39846.1 putative FMN/FAD exporter YeeO [Tessaracoccus lapidicaptus]
MSISRRILALAVPAFAALVAQPLMMLADTWIVGHLGTVPLAGLGIGSGLLTTVTGLMIFLAYGSTAVVARRIGAGQRADGIGLGVQAMWLAALLGAVVGVLVWAAAPWLATALGADGEVRTQAVTYLRWSIPGLPGMLVMLAATGTFRGLADARTPLVLSIGSAALNLVLNAALVFGLGMGIAGAALGTAAAETTLGATATALVALQARRAGARMRPSRRGMAGSLAVGTPLLLRTVTLRIALLITTYVAAAQGAAGLAAHHVVMQVWGLMAYALDALAIAGQTIIGTALGAGDAGEARSSTRLMTWWSVAAGGVIGVAAALLRQPVAAFFAPDDDVRALVAWLLVIVAATLPLAGYVYLLDGVLIGAGDGRYLAAAGVVTVVAYAPVALLALTAAQGRQGLTWLWIAFTVVFMGARAVTLGLRARGDRWLRLGG